jgi:polysaccharide deacetylase family protein (PEP-CTERM system associated)
MSVLHAISFDVEEYFQVANLRQNFPKQEWDSISSRLDIGMERILGALKRHDARATFFFLGWIAERHPGWVTRCLEAGHEVASHGYDHDFLWDLGPEGVETDLIKTEAALVAAGAPKPRGFRASTFTLTRKTFWAMDILAKRGYSYDSSIHPVRHPTYGISDFEPGTSVVETAAGPIVEFPVSTRKVLGRNLPVGGGGYFRLYPGALIRNSVGALERAGKPACIYLHPWEFDPDQPRATTSASKAFRHYVGLKQTLPRLEALLSKHRFVGLEESLIASGDL